MMKTTAAEKKTKVLLAEAFEALPKRIVCPKCRKNRPRDAFGMRVMSRGEDDCPTRIARQSWCRNCRG